MEDNKLGIYDQESRALEPAYEPKTDQDLPMVSERFPLPPEIIPKAEQFNRTGHGSVNI
jgi:hypothetical protein